MSRLTCAVFAGLSAALLLTACHSNNSPTSTTTTPVTEVFSGSFGLKGTDVHTFTVTARGDIVVTVVSLDPNKTLVVAVGLGNYDSTADPACKLYGENTTATLGQVLSSISRPAGSYCVQMRELGNLAAGDTENYTITVEHL